MPPFYVLVVPARDEELVIDATARRLLDLDYDGFLVLVMNDGSEDDTSIVARSAGALCGSAHWRQLRRVELNCLSRVAGSTRSVVAACNPAPTGQTPR